MTVVDYDRIGTSEPIGRVVLGCNATGAWRSDHSHVIALSFFQLVVLPPYRRQSSYNVQQGVQLYLYLH